MSAPSATVGGGGTAGFAPVIVCGVGRSGTSLLQSMLAAHPQLCLPPETHFFRSYVAPGAVRRQLEAAGAEALATRLAADEHYARAGIPPRELLAPWLPPAAPAGGASAERLACAAPPLRLDEVYRRLLEEYAAREHQGRQPVVVGDKDPKNIEFLPALHAAYPQARVLHIVRDPRAVLASRMDAAWSKARPWAVHPLVQVVQWARGRERGAALYGPRWLELRYEDLLAEPEAVLQRVCAHLGLDYDAAMLDFGGAARRLVADSEKAWKGDTFGPLQTGHVDKWRARLGPGQAAWAEVVCRRLMRTHGYASEAGAARRALLALPALAATAAFRLVYAASLWSRR